MYKILKRCGMILGFSLCWINSSYALDSYRFLHVTIETPWAIFLFLLLAIFAPFILMAVLVWRYTERKADDANRKSAVQAEAKE